MVCLLAAHAALESARREAESPDAAVSLKDQAHALYQTLSRHGGDNDYSRDKPWPEHAHSWLADGAGFRWLKLQVARASAVESRPALGSLLDMHQGLLRVNQQTVIK